MEAERNGMTRRLITQADLDTLWSAYDAGQTDEGKLAKLIRFSAPTLREIIRDGRRIGPDCEPERKAEAVAKLRAALASGEGVFDAAKRIGLSYSDAMREQKHRLEQIKNAPRDTLRPRHVTAEQFTGEWYDQQEAAFARAMVAAHPELARA